MLGQDTGASCLYSTINSQGRERAGAEVGVEAEAGEAWGPGLGGAGRG